MCDKLTSNWIKSNTMDRTDIQGSVNVTDTHGSINIGGQMNIYHDTSQLADALDERKRQIIQGLRSSLQTFHGDEKSSFFPLPWNDEADKLTLEDNFINVRLYETNRAVVDNSGKPLYLNELFLGADGKPIKGDRILVLAEAGFGKTMLCQKIAHDWARGKSYVSHFKLVFVIPLSNLKPSSVDQWILDSFKDEFDLNDVPDFELMDAIISIQSEILWIMDGYDEVPLSCLEMVDKVLQKKCSVFLNEATIVVTSRPSHSSLPADCFRKKVVVRGFYKEEQELFIDNFFKNDESTAKEDLKNLLWSNLKEMDAISHSPLLLYLLCCYQNFIEEEEGRVKVRTKSDIYDTIMNSLIKLSAKKNKHISEAVASFENKDQLYQILVPLGYFYSTLFQANAIVFTYDLALKVLKDDINLLYVGIFKQEKKVHFGKKKTWFRPHHHSFAEYLVSLYCEVAIKKGMMLPNCISYQYFFQEELYIITSETVIHIRSIRLHHWQPRLQCSLLQWLQERLDPTYLLVFVKCYKASAKILNSYQNTLYERLKHCSSTHGDSNHYCRLKWPSGDAVNWEDIRRRKYDELCHRKPVTLDTMVVDELDEKHYELFAKHIADLINTKQMLEICVWHASDCIGRHAILSNLFLRLAGKQCDGVVDVPKSSLPKDQLAVECFARRLFSDFDLISKDVEGIEIYFQSWAYWIYPYHETRQSFCKFLETPWPIFNVIVDLLLASSVCGMTTSYGRIDKVEKVGESGIDVTFQLVESYAFQGDSYPSIYSLTSLLTNHKVPLTAYFYSRAFKEPKNRFLWILFLLLEKRGKTVKVLPPDDCVELPVRKLPTHLISFLSLKRTKSNPMQFSLHFQAYEENSSLCFV